MLLNQVKSILEPYLLVQENDPESKLDFSSFGTIVGKNLRGANGLETMLSVLGGCECANITVRELIVRIQPFSLLALRAKNSLEQDDAGFSIELHGVRAIFRGKGEEWRSKKGDIETLDARLAILQALRTAVHDSLILEQAQHDTTTSSTVKWLGSRIVGNFRFEITDLVVDIFPEEQSERLTLSADTLLLSNSTDDPCASQGYGHVQGSSVVRKLLALNNVILKCADTEFLSVESTEISLAANMSSEATGLCTAVEIRFSDTLTNLTKKCLTRLLKVPEQMNHGLDVEKRAEHDLQRQLRQSSSVTLEDRTRIRATYIRILQSANPDADVDLQVPTNKSKEGQKYKDPVGQVHLAHEVSWLQLKELQLGENEVNKLLKDAADSIRSQRALETSQASASFKVKSAGRGWFGRSSYIDDREDTESLTVLESLSLLQQDPQRARLVFDSLDLDKSGTIDVIELQRGLENCGLNLGTDRLLHLMREIESGPEADMDSSITFNEFRSFCARVNSKHALVAPSGSSLSLPGVVSIAFVVYIQQVHVNLDTIMEATLSNLTVGFQSSGMPYYRRHDVSVGTKRVNVSLQHVSIGPTSALSIPPILTWGDACDIKKGQGRSIKSKTTLKFVEVRPSVILSTPSSPLRNTATTAEVKEEKEYGSHEGPAAAEVPNLAFRIRCEYTSDRGQRMYRTSYTQWDSPSHAVFQQLKPLEVTRTMETPINTDQELLFTLTKAHPSQQKQGFIRRLFTAPFRQNTDNLGGDVDDSEGAYVDQQTDEKFASFSIKLDRPSSAGIEFSRTKKQLRNSEKWIPSFDSSGEHVADVLVRIRTESSFVEDDAKGRPDDKKEDERPAMQMTLVHSPGIRVNDLAAKLDMAPLEVALTKENICCAQAAGVAISPDPTAPARSRPPSTLTVETSPTTTIPALTAATPSAYIPPSEENPQQMSSTPADLFGFSVYTQESPDTPVLPTLLRASVSLCIFGSRGSKAQGTVIRMVKHEEKTRISRREGSCEGHPTEVTEGEDSSCLEFLIKPCTLLIETNRGCSNEFARLIGLEGGGDHNVEAGYRYGDDGNEGEEEEIGQTAIETRSVVSGESYITAYESEPETASQYGGKSSKRSVLASVDREFHASLTFENDSCFEIVGTLVKSPVSTPKPLMTFRIDQPRAFLNMRLDPIPQADFEFRVGEILLTDDDDETCLPKRKRNILSRYLMAKDEAYGSGNQFAIVGRYTASQAFVNVSLDGFCVLATPILRMIQVVSECFPQSATIAAPPEFEEPVSRKNSAEVSPTVPPSQPEVDYSAVMVLPTAKLQSKISFTRMEVYLFEVPKLSPSLEKFRALKLSAGLVGTVDALSTSESGQVPLHETVALQLDAEMVRLDLKRPERGMNRLIDPFQVDMTFSTKRFEEPTSPSVASVVEEALVRRGEFGGNDLPVAPPEFIQELVIALDGGFNMRMDSSDVRFCNKSLTTVSELLAQEEAKTEPPVPLPPPIQSMSSKDPGDTTPPTVWTVMSTLYPMLVLSSSSATPQPQRKQQARDQVMWQRKQLAESAQQAYQGNKLNPPLQRVDIKFSHILLGVGVLGEFGFPIPFLRAHVAQLSLSAESTSGFWFSKGAEGSGAIALDCQSYNTISHSWEPLMEPWFVHLRLKRLTNGETMATALAGTRINVNITESVMFNLSKFSVFTDPEMRPPPEDGRLKGPYCPNWVVNETGVAIDVWPVRDVKDAAKPIQAASGTTNLLSLNVNRVTRLHLKDRRALFEAGDRLVEKYVAAQVKRHRRGRRGNSSAAVSQQQQPVVDRKEVLKQIFQLIDRDGNGRLSIPELQRALATQNEVIPRDQLAYEIEVATGKSASEGVSEEEFATFFSKDSTQRGGGRSESAVSSLGIRVKGESSNSNEFFLAPPHKPGVYILPTSIPNHNQNNKGNKPGSELFGVVAKMGRLVVASVLRLETRIKIENRLSGHKLIMGYFATPGEAQLALGATGKRAAAQREIEETSSSSSSFKSLKDAGMNLFSGWKAGNKPSVEVKEEEPTKVATATTKVFVPVFELCPGQSKCIPFQLLRGDAVTDFYFRVETTSPPSSCVIFTSLTSGSSSASDSTGQKNPISSRPEGTTTQVLESPNIISVGRNHEDIPIHSMRTKKKTKVESKEQLYSVLRIDPREEDLMESELVDENLIRADRIVFGKDHEFTCSERIVPSQQFFCRPVITLQVLSARGLIAMDLSGFSDPYVIVTAGEESFRTTTINKSLDPRWPGKTSTFKIGERPDHPLPTDIRLDVYDEDKMGRDDILGTVSINTQELIDDLLNSAGDGQSVIRTYSINPSKNSASKLTVGLKYESSAAISLPSKIHQRVVAFSPSLTVENILPFTLQVELSTTERNQSSGITEVYELGSGKTCVPNPYYDSALIGTNKVRLRVRPGASRSNSNRDDEVENSNKWVDIDDMDKSYVLESTGSTFLINVDLLRSKDGTRRLIFFADFWIANKAGCHVQLSFELSAASAGVTKSPSLLARNICSNLVEENETCCLCIAKSKGHDRKEVTIRAKLQQADSLETLDLISVDKRKNKDALLAVSKAVDLEDAKIQANEGSVLLQTEMHPSLLLASASSAHQHAIPLSEMVFGSVLLTIRPSQGVNSADSTGKVWVKSVRAIGRNNTLNGKKLDRSSYLLEGLLPTSSRMDVNACRRWSDWTVEVVVLEHEETEGGVAQMTAEGAEAVSARMSPGDAESRGGREHSLDEINFNMTPDGRYQQHVWRLNLASLVTGVPMRNYEFWGFLVPGQESTVFTNPPSSSISAANSPRMMELGATIHDALPISVSSRAGSGRRLVSERLAVGSTSLYGKWYRTRLITFTPSFTVAAEAGFGDTLQVLVKPYGVDDGEAILLGNVARPLRLMDVDNPQIQFRLATSPRALWTRPIPLKHEHDFAVQMRDENGRRVARFLLDVNRSGPSKCIVLRSCPEEMTHVLIRNNSQLPVFLRQVHRPPRRTVKQMLTCTSSPLGSTLNGNLREGKSVLFPLDELGSGQVLPLGFDIFEDVTNPVDEDDKGYIHVPRLMVYSSSSGRSGGAICKLRNGHKARSSDASFQLRVESRGAHMVVDIEDMSTGRSVSSNDESFGVRGDAIKKVSSDEVTLSGGPGTNFAMDLAGFGVSIFSSARQREVLYCLFQRIHFETSVVTSAERDPYYRNKPKSQQQALLWTTSKMELAIGKFQIDSSLPAANYPVMLTSDLSHQKRRRSRFFASPLSKMTQTSPAHHEQPQVPKKSGSKGGGLGGCFGSTTKHEDTKPPPRNVSKAMEQWAPKMCGEDSRRRRAEDSFLRIVTHSASPVTQPDAVIYKNIEADIKSLDVRVDEVFLGGMLSVLLAQADASAFSNANVSFDDSDNKADAVKTPNEEDRVLLRTCFEEHLAVPPRDSSFVEKSFISAWTVSLTVKLGSPDELIPLAKRYGIPSNLLVLAMRLSRLEALLFDLPNYPESAVGSEKIMVKYSALMMSAFWQQLGEVIFNIGKRALIDLGFLKRLAETDKVRLPPDPSEVVALYGPGSFPLPTEILIETNAVQRIEMWWARRQAAKEGGTSTAPPQNSSRLAEFFSSATGGGKKDPKRGEKRLFGSW